MTKRRQSIGQAWTPTANCTTSGATDPYCGVFAGGTPKIYPTRMFVKDLVDRMFGGHMDALIANLIEEEGLSPIELKRLQTILAKAKK